jgi:hypothetical protein
MFVIICRIKFTDDKYIWTLSTCDNETTEWQAITAATVALNKGQFINVLKLYNMDRYTPKTIDLHLLYSEIADHCYEPCIYRTDNIESIHVEDAAGFDIVIDI